MSEWCPRVVLTRVVFNQHENPDGISVSVNIEIDRRPSGTGFSTRDTDERHLTARAVETVAGGHEWRAERLREVAELIREGEYPFTSRIKKQEGPDGET